MPAPIEARIRRLEQATKPGPRAIVLSKGTTVAEALAGWTRDHPGERPPTFLEWRDAFA